jgi:hypothetical protein
LKRINNIDDEIRVGRGRETKKITANVQVRTYKNLNQTVS